MDTAAKELTAALAGLVVADPAVDKSVLQSAYDAAVAMSSSKYTTASWSALQAKVTSAKTVLDDGTASQTAVNTAVKELTTAPMSIGLAALRGLGLPKKSVAGATPLRPVLLPRFSTTEPTGIE